MMFTTFILASTLWTLFGMAALWRVSSRSSRSSVESVSILKPLCGADPALRNNLRSFFELEHPHFELIFGVEGHSDPAVPIVHDLMQAYPSVSAHLVIHSGSSGVPNPKVRNLLAMLPAAAHDLVIISDSNIEVPKHYAGEMAGAFLDPSVGLATSMIVARGEQGFGATLEALHLNGFVAPALAAADWAGVPAVVGKSMAFRRSTLEAIGGLVSVGHVLAEDLVLGRMFARAGFTIYVCPSPVVNVISKQTAGVFFRRHRRWGSLRARLAQLPFMLEPIAFPIVIALAAPGFGVDGRLSLAWAVGLTMLRDGFAWWRLRGAGGLLRALPLAPFRDLLALLAWVTAPFQSHVQWRGNRLRVGTGTRLYAEAPRGL